MRAKTTLMTHVVLAVICAHLAATPIFIEDNYIGAAPTHSSYFGRDVIGDANHFDVTGMTVTLDGGSLRVDIHSGFFHNLSSRTDPNATGLYGTIMGDLFISTNGYNPQEDTRYDNMANGEAWELALRLDAGGVATLVDLDPGTKILTSNHYFDPHRYIFREGQEVRVADREPEGLGTGTWTILDDASTLSFVIGMALIGNNVTELGFHWTMSCANDVIEGSVSVPVPEPATISLLVMGLAGLGLAGRKKRRA